MKNDRLGCLSPSAIMASIFTALVIMGFGVFSGSGFFTAGSLSARAGESIGGVSSHFAIGNDCAKCHPAPWASTTQADLCQACHKDIADQLTQPKSMHGQMLKDEPLACRACHPDHRGTDAPLTEMKSGNFPHEGTGYSLKSHLQRSNGTPFTCADCHADDISIFDPAVCTTCHEQIDKAFMASHTQAYGTDCRSCHDGMETISKNFDHSLATFKLDGKHVGTACADCHAGARVAADFKATPAECFACHGKDDDHKGQLGQDCASCHNTSWWKPSTFDHNLSVFKLEDKHTVVKCEDCHQNKVFKGLDSSCYSCHQKDDEHDGNFGQDCGLCHTPSDWERTTFDHTLSAFKLEGKHTEVECEDCHKNNVFKGLESSCYSCHQKDDQHNGNFGQVCEACHEVTGWKPASFDHNLSAFRLSNGHANVACERCHVNNVFEGTRQECSFCHFNPAFHAGMFSGTECSSCHTTVAWRPGKYTGSHPGISGDDGGRGVNHGGGGCRSCHTVNLSTATCTACHKNNNPGDDGGGED